MIVARPDFVRHYPIATKRRACHPQNRRHLCVESRASGEVRGRQRVLSRYEIALDVVKSFPTRWRTHNPEDSLRFHGLRLYEGG
jgi:hypothetical protein